MSTPREKPAKPLPTGFATLTPLQGADDVGLCEGDVCIVPVLPDAPKPEQPKPTPARQG